MKNKFIEPEIELLKFLCDEVWGADSYDTEEPIDPILPPALD